MRGNKGGGEAGKRGVTRTIKSSVGFSFSSRVWCLLREKQGGWAGEVVGMIMQVAIQTS